MVLRGAVRSRHYRRRCSSVCARCSCEKASRVGCATGAMGAVHPNGCMRWGVVKQRVVVSSKRMDWKSGERIIFCTIIFSAGM
jgi:hypothetical protein